MIPIRPGSVDVAIAVLAFVAPEHTLLNVPRALSSAVLVSSRPGSCSRCRWRDRIRTGTSVNELTLELAVRRACPRESIR